MPRLYTTRDSDMWDLISFKMYGSEYYRDAIVDANPLYYDVERFTDGSVLTIPDLPPDATVSNPPWVAIGS